MEVERWRCWVVLSFAVEVGLWVCRGLVVLLFAVGLVVAFEALVVSRSLVVDLSRVDLLRVGLS